MRKILAKNLRDAGVQLEEIFEAGNGRDALKILETIIPDLILSDVNMPIMDGMEFVKALHDLPAVQGVPVIMVTSEGSESHVKEAILMGARGYVRKPFTPEQFRTSILPCLPE